MKIKNSRIDPDNQPQKPFTIVDKETREQPFTILSKDINEPDQFVINRLTDNGAYVKGGMLYFRLNGVDIFTDINYSIFINKANNSIVIRNADNLSNIDDDSIDSEFKQYIILIYGVDEDQEVFRWESMTGRTTMYNYIKNNVDSIDVDNSIILTENVPIKDAFTVFQFVKYLQNGNLIEDDEDFDIDYYTNGGN